MSALLVLDSYGKSFGERVVLHSASIWGTPGRITVVMGRNGSGKSTLLRAGLGLIPSDQGVTHWDGEPILRPRLHALARRGLFFLPDRGMLSKRLALKDQIGFYLEAFGGNAAQVIEDFRLVDLLDLRVGQLSGGEARRGELALARLRAPRCLVADEPFAGLGPIDRIVVADELRAHARRGAAVIATGHEVEDLMDVADEVVWMVAGTTHVLGGAEVARAHGQFRREYLGPRGGHGGAAGSGVRVNRVGVISDTHGLLRPEALAALAGSELIVHAGDVGSPEILERLAAVAPVRAVRGNTDHGAWADALPLTEAVEVDGVGLYVLHILADLDLDPGASEFAAVIYGHSHKPLVERRRGVLYLNPGSAGPRRFNLPVSVARLTVDGGRCEAEIVELT